MASSGRTVVGLPTLTEAALHTKSTNRLTGVDAYQTLPDFLPGQRNHMVVLVWSAHGLPIVTNPQIWLYSYRVRPLPIITTAKAHDTQ